MMPESKADYIRCGFHTRYCAFQCPHCKQGHNDEGELWYWCWYPYALYEKHAIPLVRKDVTALDDFGNIFVTGVPV